MGEHPRELGRLSIIVRTLAGEPVDEIPVALDAEFLAPFESLHVHQGGTAFAHELEGMRAQALDARLDQVHARLAEHPDLVLAQISLDLEKYRHPQLLAGERRNEV